MWTERFGHSAKVDSLMVGDINEILRLHISALPVFFKVGHLGTEGAGLVNVGFEVGGSVGAGGSTTRRWHWLACGGADDAFLDCHHPLLPIS